MDGRPENFFGLSALDHVALSLHFVPFGEFNSD
jgi:hypothetical protein